MSILSDPRWSDALSRLPDFLGSHVRVSMAALAHHLTLGSSTGAPAATSVLPRAHHASRLNSNKLGDHPGVAAGKPTCESPPARCMPRPSSVGPFNGVSSRRARFIWTRWVRSRHPVQPFRGFSSLIPPKAHVQRHYSQDLGIIVGDSEHDHVAGRPTKVRQYLLRNGHLPVLRDRSRPAQRVHPTIFTNFCSLGSSCQSP